ncbi:hypothetical protein [Nannocystis pusilla]|uniref:hypothetical protein n=1 Tax=Nannocystis pusilla TaxID=889268 RepID=UPI003B811EDE
MAAKAPNLCRECFVVDKRSEQRLAALLSKGYPKPSFQAGWAAGAFGLGRVLGAVAVYAGSQDARVNGQWQRNMLPLIDLEPDGALQRLDVQAWLGAVLACQALNNKVPTITTDAANTWGNVFSAVSDLDSYNAGNGLTAKEIYLQRATEAGVDLQTAPSKSQTCGRSEASGRECRPTRSCP